MGVPGHLQLAESQPIYLILLDLRRNNADVGTPNFLKSRSIDILIYLFG
jgi:hypothetical protein